LLSANTLPALLALPTIAAEQLICLAFPGVLVLGVTARIPSEREPGLAWLGMISFPLYATHFPLFEAAGLVMPDLSPAQRVPLVIATLIAAVALADRLGRSRLSRGFAWPPGRKIVAAAAAR
jgi:peptidoglycan/LPS O-acetylase OafA/YrhL